MTKATQINASNSPATTTIARKPACQVWTDVDPAEGSSVWVKYEGNLPSDNTHNRREAVSWAKEGHKVSHYWDLS